MKLYVLKGFNGEIPDLAARPLIVKEYKEIQLCQLIGNNTFIMNTLKEIND